MRAYSRRKGFSLVELMISLVILSILMGFAIPEVIKSINEAKQETRENNRKEIRKAIDRFYGDRGRYPRSLDELTNVTHPYFQDLPKDPYTEDAKWEIKHSNRSDSKDGGWYRTSERTDSGLALWPTLHTENAQGQVFNPALENQGICDVRPRKN
jgi:general secretion pathway protein G